MKYSQPRKALFEHPADCASPRFRWDADVARRVYMHAHVLHTFAYVSAAFAASPAPTQPSMKEAALRAASTKGGGRLRRPPPFVDSFMDGCAGAGEAADAAETYANICET